MQASWNVACVTRTRRLQLASKRVVSRIYSLHRRFIETPMTMLLMAGVRWSQLCQGWSKSPIHNLFSVSVPEGFAYYALHPLDYADLVARLELNVSSALVVGVRSIGTTISAVATAKLREFGIAASRFTVRPTGHPYERACKFDAVQLRVIAANVAADGSRVGGRSRGGMQADARLREISGFLKQIQT